MKVHLTTVVGSYVKVLPHMLAHYRELGVESFLINAHLSHQGDEVLEEIEKVTAEFTSGINSVTVGDWETEQVGIYARSRQQYPNDWFIIADQDELQVYPFDLFEVIRLSDQKGYDYITGAFVDRLAIDGGFPEVEAEKSIWSQFPLGAFISYPVLQADPRKVVAAKGHVALCKGQHKALSGKGCPAEEFFIQVHHFKWVADIAERLRKRALTQKQAKVMEWGESQRFISYYEKHGGKFDITDSRLLISKRYKDYEFWEQIREMFIDFQDKDIMPLVI
jgi:hypothetical protein